MSDQPTGLTFLGKLITVVLILGLVAGGVFLVMNRGGGDAPAGADGSHAGPVVDKPGEEQASDDTGGDEQVAPAEMKVEVPRLAPPAPYVPKDNVIEVELSEYAGYAGLIAANGGLEPNDNSVFAKKHGFKVRLTLSEEESWSKLNSGGMAASATTVDVLAVYGRQFNVVVPAQIGFSRGADGIVVRSDIKRINQLKGKTLATGQFTEAEFFIRYLAQEAGIGVNNLPDTKSQPHPDRINLVFTDDAFAAGDLFLQDLKSGGKALAGCVTWAPKTTEVAEASGGKAQVLVTNKNLLIIADILVVNRGFAEKNPKIVAGLVDGLLEGNRMVRDNPAAHRDVIARAFKWSPDDVSEELSKVHLSNLPENLAFFSGAIDAAGSFGGIYQSAVLAYGPELIPNPPPAERFLDLSHLQALEKGGAYKDQKVAIAPISSGPTAPLEDDPLLSKDIRFTFIPNEHAVDMNDPANIERLESIRQLLQVSPGSIIALRGHVDDARVEEFKKQGPEILRRMTLAAVELSQKRADAVKQVLIEKYKIDPARLEAVGVGWREPVGTDPDANKRMEQNRRVEVQWFTVE